MSQQAQETTDGPSSSPRISRMQEKEELAYLNDRFASYIEQVRSLKETNIRYEFEVCTLKEQLGREAEDIKKLYEAELNDARALIDETAKERARQQLIASKNSSRVRELEAEVKDLKDELESMRNRVSAAERQAASAEAQRKSALADRTSMQKQLKDKEDECEEQRANLEELRSLLESETLSKVDYQNNLQSLNEELSFRKKVYEEELQGLRTKMVTQARGVGWAPDTSGDTSQFEYLIDELREKSDGDISDFKAMLSAAYRDKLAKLENQSNRDAATISQLNMEIRKFTGNMNENKGEITRLQKQIEKLEGQLDYKDNEIARQAQKHASELARFNDELRTLREDYETKIKEYEVLMDLKVQLDQEIATYRILLQEEENRLNLTPTPREKRTRPRTTAEQPATKKARVESSGSKQTSSISSSAAGCIQICEVDSTGRFVQIKNMSDSAESIGGFRIVHEVTGQKEIAFKFHQKSKLQGGASVTVWGSEASGCVHNPPHDIIWRNQASWGTGTNAVTKLISKSGEVVATFTQRCETSPSKYDAVDFDTSAQMRSFPRLSEVEKDMPASTSSSRTTRTKTTTTTTTTSEGGRSVGEEHMFHQQGDPQPSKDSSCVIS